MVSNKINFISSMRRTYGAVVVFGLIVAIACFVSCSPIRYDSEFAGIGRTNYLLGTLYALDSNSVIDAEFELPNAHQCFVSTVVEGVSYTNIEQTEYVLKELQSAGLEISLYEKEMNNLLWRANTREGQVGQQANWYAPNLSFVTNPCARVRRIEHLDKTPTPKVYNELIVGKTYKVHARMLGVANITNAILIRVDLWGIH